MICASVYLLVFMRNLLMHLAEKILLMHPLTFGGDYQFTMNNFINNWPPNPRLRDDMIVGAMLVAIVWFIMPYVGL
jgi:hypothetical protein